MRLVGEVLAAHGWMGISAASWDLGNVNNLNVPSRGRLVKAKLRGWVIKNGGKTQNEATPGSRGSKWVWNLQLLHATEKG